MSEVVANCDKLQHRDFGFVSVELASKNGEVAEWLKALPC